MFETNLHKVRIVLSKPSRIVQNSQDTLAILRIKYDFVAKHLFFPYLKPL